MDRPETQLLSHRLLEEVGAAAYFAQCLLHADNMPAVIKAQAKVYLETGVSPVCVRDGKLASRLEACGGLPQ